MEVSRCELTECPLWIYRRGRESKIGSENTAFCDSSEDFDDEMDNFSSEDVDD